MAQIKDKIKVIWLCHFANLELSNYFKKKPIEISPWITHTLNLFKDNNEIELHLVSPNLFTNKDCSFVIGNIHYHFYKYYFFPIIFRKLLNKFHFKEITRFNYNKNKIEKIVKALNPDLIHLHGAENPYYSIGVLPFINKNNLLVTIQGFIRNTLEKNNFETKFRIKLEEEIIKKAKHFGTRTIEMNQIIKEINPKAILHYHNYNVEKPIPNNDKSELFDIVYFARITRDKGIEDLLHAIVKIKNRQIKVKIIGQGDKGYIDKLKEFAIKNKLDENIEFIGYLKTQKEIHDIAKNAKICVLPTYHDAIPGTIIESMFMKTPVIAYAVGGIPELNKNIPSIIVIEKGNIEELANAIEHLLLNPNKRKLLANNAFETINNLFGNENILISNIIKCYKEVIYYNNKN